jgi:predicted transcriptional regulator YdeE
MNHETVFINEKKLIGISVRTNNKNETNQETGKIHSTMMKFYNEAMFSKIKNHVNSDLVYCVYTDYENDLNGDYTYFIGQEISSFDNQLEEFQTLKIQSQNYAEFTSELGQVPQIIIDVWTKIWKEDLKNRSYKTDFEVYDRSQYHANPEKYSANIYIGIDV